MEQSTATSDVTIAAEQATPLSQLVIDAVAEAKDADPIDLDPLYGAIEPDALDAIFGPQLGPAGDPPTGEVEFPYEGYDVRVTAAGRVELSE